MKTQKPLFFIIAFFIIISSISNHAIKAQNQRTAEVNYGGETEKGTIFLEVVGYGKGWETASEEAEKKVFEVLLFQGLPATAQDKPFVEDEKTSRQENEVFYTTFFQQKKYKNFLMKISSNTKPKKVRKEKQATFYFKINTDALRKHLENNQIIRKFGY